MLNPDNTTVTPNITDSGIAFAGASFTTDLAFPTSSINDSNANGTSGGDNNDTGSSGGLSTGAKAAIGASVVVLVLIGTLLGFWLFNKRKTKNNPKPYNNDYQLSDVAMSQKNLTSAQGPIS